MILSIGNETFQPKGTACPSSGRLYNRQINFTRRVTFSNNIKKLSISVEVRFLMITDKVFPLIQFILKRKFLRYIKQKTTVNVKSINAIYRPLPLEDNFLVFIILAAYSTFVSLCTHLRTMLKAPLKKKTYQKFAK